MTSARSSVTPRSATGEESPAAGLPRAERPGRPEPLQYRETLAERYARIAHEGHPSRGVDIALRSLDLAIAGTAGVLLSPLLIGVAAAIRVTSGGPVLYRGRRVGRA